MIRKVVQSSFFQLLFVYTFIVLIISMNLIYRYSFHLEVLALFLGVISFFIINSLETKQTDKYIHYFFIIFSFVLIIFFRLVPYINNSIPIGYDAGIYKYIIEHGTNYDQWILQGTEPGFLYFMTFLSFFLSSEFILIWLFTAFSVLLGYAIYMTTKIYFDDFTAIIALLIYSLSSVQFLTFSYLYYKNITALSTVLFSLCFLKKFETNPKKINFILFILMAILTGILHRPTFYIFGLSYFFYVFIAPFSKKDYYYNFAKLIVYICAGILILFFTIIFYLGKFSPAILVMFDPVLNAFFQPGEAPGTFINFFTYQFATLAYLPFAFIGLFWLLKNKKINVIFLWTLIVLIIVYFKFFFFNRFIIHLDIMLIIVASVGFSLVISQKRNVGFFILTIMLMSSFIVIYNESSKAAPIVSEREIEAISYLQNTEANAYVIATSSLYSPVVLGYSQRKTIAPGLFDDNKHSREQWIEFWKTNNLTYIKQFMNAYKTNNNPLYVFIGEKQKDNIAQFKPCFDLVFNKNNNKIYKYKC